ncbi:hypothetical protein PCIT_b0796 [Pseudoalteromonas citrea]|uniref:Peroxiredoxin n=2 Tax=Pseudoalteromonas citrea TaxID=43655 RepID=A0AAD4AF05_9GAMM|nr:OsmC family protein [Pseudoalteromonas citrea]KAF7764740.1 hypothetical protein PCIT_b0796 [Pseudoalteromonas citrea]
MSQYKALIQWNKKPTETFIDRQYSRVHQWQFSTGTCIEASSSPTIVPLPYSQADNIDPEEAFVAALSSCHMLFFLDLAAQQKLVVNSYVDNACGTLALDTRGKKAMTYVLLAPSIAWGDNTIVSKQLEMQLHHQAHDLCFIANSVLTQVEIKPIC